VLVGVVRLRLVWLRVCGSGPTDCVVQVFSCYEAAEGQRLTLLQARVQT